LIGTGADSKIINGVIGPGADSKIINAGEVGRGKSEIAVGESCTCANGAGVGWESVGLAGTALATNFEMRHGHGGVCSTFFFCQAYGIVNVIFNDSIL
jgi:hypothetical protein